MSVDIELEDLRREWRGQETALPDLRARVRRQNLRKGAALALLVLCLVVGTALALGGRGGGWSGFASGLWLTTLLVGGYAWHVGRGAWRPASQTTRAYLELMRRRAVAQERTLRCAFRFLLVALTLYAGYLALSPGRITAGRVVVLALLGLEVPLFLYLQRRNRKSRAEAVRLVEQAGASDDETSTSEGEDRS